MSFIKKTGEVVIRSATVKTGVAIKSGDVLEAESGKVKLATSTSTSASIVGVALGDSNSGGECSYLPKGLSGLFEADVAGGTVQEFEYYDLSNQNTINGSSTGTLDQVRVLEVINAKKALVQFT